MPVTNKRDDEQYRLENDSYAQDIRQFERFLNDNKKDLDVKEVGRVKQSNVSKNFVSGQEYTCEFELIMMSDGSTVKGSYSMIPKSSEGDDDDKPGASKNKDRFELDLSNVHDPKVAREAFEKFFNVVNQHYLKQLPANQPLHIYTEGGGKWEKLGQEVHKEQLLKDAQKFQDKGIEVYFNDELLIGRKAELENTSEGKKSKPWDIPRVPHGAPDLQRKK